jgi:molybdopterin/thiamine biosynthesis adenylyltransferase
VLVVGLSPTGVEVAKNLVLSGLRRLSLIMGTHTHEEGMIYGGDLQVNIHKLSHLNPFVQVDEGSLEYLESYNVVVVCDYKSYADLFDLARRCRLAHVPILLGESRSTYGRVVVDLGESFTVHDPNGEAAQEYHIDCIDDHGVVTLPKG